MKSFFNDKRVVIIYIVVFFFLILGITYAVDNVGIALNVGTAIVKIDETAYGSTTFDSNNLEFIPILDSDVGTVETAGNVVKIDFTVGGSNENTASNIIYDIALNDLEINCELLSPYIKWKLIKNGEEISNGSLDYKFDTIVDGRLVLTTIQQDLPVYSSTQNNYDDYEFYMWFSDSCQSDLETCKNNGQLADQSAMLGKNLSGKIEVELYTKEKKELVRDPSNTLDSSTCGNYYQVTYNYNGGTGTEISKMVAADTVYGTLETPTRVHTILFNTAGGTTIASQTVTYTFEGWYSDAGLTNQVTSTTEIVENSNHTLYAKWSGDGKITLPTTDPTRANYTFEGWYLDSSFNIVANNDTVYISDTTVYAKWKSNTYLVKFYKNEDYLATANSIISKISDRFYYKKYSDPALVGYIYNGSSTGPLLVGTTENSVAFYTNSNDTVRTYGGTFVVDGTTYYYSSGDDWMSGDLEDTSGLGFSKYSNMTIETAARQLLNDNTSTVEQEVLDADSQTLTTNTYTKLGYTFAGWSLTSTGTGQYSDGQSVSSLTPGDSAVVNLYAVWEPITYTIQYTKNVTDTNTVTGTMENTIVTYGVGTRIRANTYARTGYTFGGWYIKRGSSNKWYYDVGDTTGWYDYGEQPEGGTLHYYNDEALVWATSTVSGDTVSFAARWVDSSAPTPSLTSTSTLNATIQTATLTCSDNVGVTSYYWGKTAPSTSTPYTSITSTTSMSVIKTVNSTGTYYLACKDANGNVSTTVSKNYYSYAVNNYLVTTTGTWGTYTTANYDLVSTSSTYIAPSGTSLTLASIYTIPTGSSAGRFAGVSQGTGSTTAATVSTTAPSLTTNTTYSMWFNRNLIYIKYSTNGGTITGTTSDSSNTYTWTTDSSGIISRSVNGDTASNSWHTIRYGSSSFNLANHNNTGYINVTRSGYLAVPNSEWICLSGCTTSGAVFDQDADYAPSVFCDAASADCTITVGVNWSSYKTAVINGTRYCWNAGGYEASGSNVLYYPSNSSSSITYTSSTTPSASTINSTKRIGSCSGSAYMFTTSASSTTPKTQYTSPASSVPWTKVYINSSNVSGSEYYAQLTDIDDNFVVNGTAYYAVYIEGNTSSAFSSIS